MPLSSRYRQVSDARPRVRRGPSSLLRPRDPLRNAGAPDQSVRFPVRRRMVSFAASLMLALCAVSSTAQPAYAACAPPRSGAGGTYNVTAALDLSPGKVNGVSALLEEYNPYTTDSTGTNVTVMLTQSNGSGWAQFGWFKTRIREPDGEISIFMRRWLGIEMHQQQGPPFWQFWDPEPVGTMTWYEITYDEGASLFRFFLEGYQLWSWQKQMPVNVYEVMGETHNRKDQIPGSVSNHVVMNNVNYFTPPGFTPHISTIYIAPNPLAAPFAGVWPPNLQSANGRYEIWDTGCP